MDNGIQERKSLQPPFGALRLSIYTDEGRSPELSIYEKYINIPNTSLFFWKIQLWGRAQKAQENPGALRIIFYREAKILYEVMLKKS